MLQIFKELKSISSIKKKLARVQLEVNNELLKEVVYLALSPRIKFYIRKVPEYVAGTLTNPISLKYAMSELNVLSSRQKTGNEALAHLHTLLASVSSDDAQVLELIIKGDLKCGVGVSIVNKVWKDLIEETPYMGAIPYNVKKILNLIKNDKQGAVSQEKIDGRYGNCIVTPNDVLIESRGGEETLIGNQFDFLTKFVDNIVLNGELIIEGISRYTSNGIIASVISINKKITSGISVVKEISEFELEYGMSISDAQSKIVYVCWDIITLDEYDKTYSSTPYSERFELLSDIVTRVNSPKLKLVDSKVVKSLEEANADFQDKISSGKEGTILKGLSGAWKDGKPSYQIKFKLDFVVDMKIKGFKYGTKGTKNEHVISSVIVETEDGKLVAAAAGINEKLMTQITNEMDSLIDTILQVECSGISVSKDGYGLLHPRWDESRPDKNKANTLDEVLAIELGIKQGTILS